MRVAVCDDQLDCRTQAVQAIRASLRSTGVRVDDFRDGPSFLQAFTKNPFDLVFLVIEMPGMNGITVARRLRQLHRDVPIVFLTSHIEYALEGYEVNALRYLTKPIQSKKLQEVLDFVSKSLQAQRVLWIKTELGEEKLPVDQILYMEAQNQNVRICVKNSCHCVRYNLADYEKELAEDGFFRIHRGYMVSLRHIQSVGKGQLTLSDGTALPVSRTKEKELKEALFQYIRKEAF